MLILSRKSGEALIINEEIEIKIIEVNGDKVKIGINAPQNVKILRSELRQTAYQELILKNCLIYCPILMISINKYILTFQDTRALYIQRARFAHVP